MINLQLHQKRLFDVAPPSADEGYKVLNYSKNVSSMIIKKNKYISNKLLNWHIKYLMNTVDIKKI